MRGGRGRGEGGGSGGGDMGENSYNIIHDIFIYIYRFNNRRFLRLFR